MMAFGQVAGGLRKYGQRDHCSTKAAIPFPINNHLFNRCRSTCYQTQTQPCLKSLLGEVPKDWTEASTCQWLNNIGDTLRLIHPDIKHTNWDGVVITPSKRVWTSAYSSIYMKQDNVNNPSSSIPHRLAMVQFGLGLGTFWPNPNLDFEVWSGRLVNPNPEPIEPGRFRFRFKPEFNSNLNIF